MKDLHVYEGKIKHDTAESQNEKLPRGLTCVADSFTLDLPCYTCALFHITEVNSSPRFSDVIIAQVYGFVALPWEQTKKSRHDT